MKSESAEISCVAHLFERSCSREYWSYLVDTAPEGAFTSPVLRGIRSCIDELSPVDGGISDMRPLIAVAESKKLKLKISDVMACINVGVIAEDHAKKCATIVKDLWRKREAIQAINKITKPGNDVSIDTWLQESSAALSSVVCINDNKPASLSDISESMLAKENDGLVVPTMFDSIDQMATIYTGTLTVVAARPGIGKTAFMMGLVERNIYENLVITCEMSNEQLVRRYVSSTAGKQYKDVTKKDIYEYIPRMSSIPTRLYEPRSNLLSDIAATIRMEKIQRNIRTVYIDYVQLCRLEGLYQSREREVSFISETLKELAKEQDIAIIALAQLNRELEKRRDRRPMLSDLRESGALEQDASAVLMLYREEMYNKECDDPNDCEVIITKNRYGATGTAHLIFEKEYTRFS